MAINVGAVTAKRKGKRKWRKITLDPLRELTAKLPFREVESTIPCGLQIEWVSGKAGKEKVSMSSGAGCGSTWATFDYKGKEYCFEVGDLIKAMIEAINR